MVHYKEMRVMDFQQDERQEIGKANVIIQMLHNWGTL